MVQMEYNFTHTGFDFAAFAPVDNGKWLEADAAGGVAWLALAAYAFTGHSNQTLLTAAHRSITFLDTLAW